MIVHTSTCLACIYNRRPHALTIETRKGQGHTIVVVCLSIVVCRRRLLAQSVTTVPPPPSLFANALARCVGDAQQSAEPEEWVLTRSAALCRALGVRVFRLYDERDTSHASAFLRRVVNEWATPPGIAALLLLFGCSAVSFEPAFLACQLKTRSLLSLTVLVTEQVCPERLSCGLHTSGTNGWRAANVVVGHVLYSRDRCRTAQLATARDGTFLLGLGQSAPRILAPPVNATNGSLVLLVAHARPARRQDHRGAGGLMAQAFCHHLDRQPRASTACISKCRWTRFGLVKSLWQWKSGTLSSEGLRMPTCSRPTMGLGPKSSGRDDRYGDCMLMSPISPTK